MAQTGLKPPQKSLQKLILWHHHCFMPCCSISVNTLREVLPHPYRAQIHKHLTLESFFLMTSGRDGKIGGNLKGTICYCSDGNEITQPQNWEMTLKRPKVLKLTGSQLCFCYGKMGPNIIFSSFSSFSLSFFFIYFVSCASLFFAKLSIFHGAAYWCFSTRKESVASYKYTHFLVNLLELI